MTDSPNFRVVFVLGEEVLPVIQALLVLENPAIRRCASWWEYPQTCSSSSSKPRMSCVWCSLKHPVANARAASLPALVYTRAHTRGLIVAEIHYKHMASQECAHMNPYDPAGPYVRRLDDTSYTSWSICHAMAMNR